MADRGRDFKVSFLSDTSQLDTSDAASQLDDLADAAQDAGRKLDDLDGREAGRQLDALSRDAKAAESDVERFGDQTKATAKEVDDAFDRIRKSSKQGIGDGVKEGTDKAEAGLGEFRDEANSTAKEAAASFDGSAESIADAFQEVAANAFAGFGPAGAAAGLLAAAGLGSALSKLQEIADQVNQSKQDVVDLANELIDAGGALDGEQVSDRIRQWADEIIDTRSWFELWQRDAVTNFDVVQQAAKDTGLSTQLMLRAMSGSDVDSANRALSMLRTQVSQLQGAMTESNDFANAELTTQIRARQDLIDRIQSQLDVTQAATDRATAEAEALGVQTRAVEDLRQAQEDLSSAIDDFTEPAAVYSQLLADKTTKEQEAAQATADATASSKDSWEDYAKDVTVTLDEYTARLAEQVESQDKWASNMQELAGRVSTGTLQQLARLGPEGAPLVQQLVDASDEKVRQLDGLMQRAGAAAAQNLGSGLTSGTPYIKEQAGRLVQAVRDSVTGQEIILPVTVHLNRAQYDAQLNALRKQAAMERAMP